MYITCQTDKGRFAIRPIDWAGIFNENGHIHENGLNHTAIFLDNNDAQWYTEILNAMENKNLSKQRILDIIQNC